MRAVGGHRLGIRTGDGKGVLAHRRGNLVAAAVDQRAVEESMADPSSSARHGRVASLGRLDHPVEGVTQAGVVVTVAVGGAGVRGVS